ncbi:hypothetical protein B0H14DRAFT_3872425 [Mycena olivaceomarginata]|nr:hypothetical protein B0H14DRAFT_3872425 [Mycena olivaceomarginata]
MSRLLPARAGASCSRSHTSLFTADGHPSGAGMPSTRMVALVPGPSAVVEGVEIWFYWTQQRGERTSEKWSSGRYYHHISFVLRDEDGCGMRRAQSDLPGIVGYWVDVFPFFSSAQGYGEKRESCVKEEYAIACGMGCGFARADTGFWMVDIVIGTPRFTIFLLSALVSPLSFFPLFMHMHGRILPCARFHSPTAPRSLSCTGW